jgi:hypothetical protein
MVKKEEDVTPRMSEEDKHYLIDSIRRELLEKARKVRILKQEIDDLSSVLRRILEEEN